MNVHLTMHAGSRLITDTWHEYDQPWSWKFEHNNQQYMIMILGFGTTYLFLDESGEGHAFDLIPVHISKTPINEDQARRILKLKAFL